MVGRWGMSEKVGPIVLLPSDGQPAYPGTNEHSAETEALIDDEVHRIVEEAHAEVTQLLTEHRDQLDRPAHARLEAETLDAPAAYAAADVPMRAAELEAAVAPEHACASSGRAGTPASLRCRWRAAFPGSAAPPAGSTPIR